MPGAAESAYHRAVMLRRASLLLLALGGCQCGEEDLGVARAILEVTPVALDFGEVVRGDLRLLSVELANVGTLDLTMTSTALAQATREFSFASAVPVGLAPAQRAMVNLVYEPADLGEDLGTLTFAADDEGETFVVSLRGVGVEPGAGVALEGEGCAGQPDSLAFGATPPGVPVERRITVRSVGGAPLEVLSAVVEPGSSGEWSIDAGTLPQTLPAGGELVLVARYTPVDGGADQGAFVITTSAPATASIRIPACGTGIAPAICARPVPLDLGAVPVGATRSGRLTVESCGLQPLTISALALSTDPQFPSGAGFAVTTTLSLPLTLAPTETVELDVTYTGRAPFGPAQAWVRAESNAQALAVAHFPVRARTASPCDLFVAPATLAYRGVAPGMSATRAALVGNAGESDCTVSALAVTSTSGYFALVGTSTGFDLPAGDARTVEVTYAPTAPGLHEGTLTVTDVSGSTQTVALLGNPVDPMGCAVEVVPTVGNFGVVAVGTTAHLGLRVTAIGEDACRISAARLVAGNTVFAVTLPLLRIALPGAGGVTIDVAYTPTAAGPSSDVVEIDFAALAGGGNGTVQVGVSGVAGEGRICVTPGALAFGAVSSGNSLARTVVIESCGTADLDLRGVLLNAPAGSPFRLSRQPTITQRLPAGANATPAVEVTYAPTDAGPHFGQLEILSSDPQDPAVTVPLSGNFAGGCDQILQCTPGTVAFGDTGVGTDKIVRVVCRSVGPAPVTISSVALSGGAPELSLTMATTPVTMAPGDAWTVDVRYRPTAVAPANASLIITSNACLGPPTLPVSGAGIEVVIPPCMPPSTFAPREQWSWRTTTVEPTFTNVWSTPLVANLDDDNADGHIDENDVPDVVFISLDTYSLSDPSGSVPGVLRVLSGDTGREKFSVTSPRFADTAIPAIGDLDGDGRPEIIGIKWVQTPMGTGQGGFFGRYTTGTMVALDNTGRLLWESDPYTWTSEVTFNAAAPAIADLDGDGFAEVILGREVFDHRGRLKWRGTADHGMATAGPHSIVADVDLDGHPEVIAAGTLYAADGTVIWDIAAEREGGTAVGMLDPLDPFPQIVIRTPGLVTVYDHLGMQKWRTIIPSMGATTLLPVIADFDGDGWGDIAIADGEAMHVLSGTGGIVWSAPVSDSTCCAGISAFDFEGDGKNELILTDNGTAYIYRGDDGTRIFSAARPNPTAFEMPVVADVDNDSKGELLVALFGPNLTGGLIAYSNVGDNWVGAPRIFNQQSYHVTNVYESGAIPRVETPIPQAPKLFRGQSASCR